MMNIVNYHPPKWLNTETSLLVDIIFNNERLIGDAQDCNDGDSDDSDLVYI